MLLNWAKAHYKILIIAGIVILLSGSGWVLSSRFAPNIYHGWITGIVSDNKTGSLLVLVNPATKECKKVLTLPDVNPQLAQYGAGAVSPDGKYAAYIKQEDLKTFLVVEQLNKEIPPQVYFNKDVGESTYGLSWMPNGYHLIFIHSQKEVYPNQEICMLDVKNNNLYHLVKGGVWDGRNYVLSNPDPKIDDGRWVDYMSQEQLDKLIKEYGGTETIPVEENGGKLFVDFSTPNVSPDGSKIIYSATLNRDYAMEGKSLWLASGIWVLNANGGKPKLVYANHEPGTAIGKVVWSSDGKQLVFYRYRGMNGADGGLYCLEIASGNTKPIIPNSNEHLATLGALTMPDNQILFISVSNDNRSNKEKRFMVNIDTGDITPWDMEIDGKETVLWGFSNLY